MMDVETGDILMATRGDGQSKSSFVKLHAENSLHNTNVLTIGTVKATMDSVHNAIRKVAEMMADIMVSTIIGASAIERGIKRNRNNNRDKMRSIQNNILTSQCVAERIGHVAFVEYVNGNGVYYTEANINSNTDLKSLKLWYLLLRERVFTDLSIKNIINYDLYSSTG